MQSVLMAYWQCKVYWYCWDGDDFDAYFDDGGNIGNAVGIGIVAKAMELFLIQISRMVTTT